MDALSITTITFGLKILQEIGFSGSLVFSPVLLLLSEHNATARSKLFNYEDLRKRSKIEGFHTENDMNLVNSTFTATWRYPYRTSHHHMKFKTDTGKVKHVNFVTANTTLSEELVANHWGFRIAEDDVFTVLKIPLNKPALRLVIFLPKPNYTLAESITKLDTSRIGNLFRDFNVYNVHFKIPCLEMSSTLDTSTLMRLQNSKFHKIRFNWRQPSEKYLEQDEDFHEPFVKRIPDRTPFHFIANRPFFYTVFKHRIPILMGIFTGTRT